MKKAAVLIVGVGVVAAFGAVGLGIYMSAPPDCRDTRMIAKVIRILRDDHQLGSVFLNDVATVSGGLFSDSRVCAAQIAQIRGNESASTLPWRELRFRIMRPDKSQPFDVTVELGSNVPLAPPQPSFWQRLLENI